VVSILALRTGLANRLHSRQSWIGSGSTLRTSLLFAGDLGVEPRGFESLTSAVQSQSIIIVDVRRCSTSSAKRPIASGSIPRLFTVVRVGRCTTGVYLVLLALPFFGQTAWPTTATRELLARHTVCIELSP
jgi:hypothetical protein